MAKDIPDANEGSLVDSVQKPNRLLNRTDIIDKLTYILIAYTIVAIVLCMATGLFTRNVDLLLNVAAPLLIIDAIIGFCCIIIILRVYDYPLRYLIEG